MRLRTSAKEHSTDDHKVPIVRITAMHQGVCDESAKNMEPEQFRGLEYTIEVAEHAKVIITHNLSVENGLMNGTFGEVKQIIFEKGHNPNATNPSHRMPHAIVVDCPSFSGPSFYDETLHPERRTWVPILALTVPDEERSGITRTQFPLVLGWALTL